MRTIAAVVALLIANQANAELPPLSVRTFHVPPWVVIDKQKMSGVAIDDLTAFGKLLPFAMNIETFPWKRALNTSRANFPDPVALFPCTPQVERDSYFLYSNQFRSTNTVLLSKIGTLQERELTLDTLKDRQPLRLAVREGHILQHYLKKHDIAYAQANSIEQLMQLLIRDRVDVIYDYDKVFDDYFGVAHTRELHTGELHTRELNDSQFQRTVVGSISYGFCINRHSDHAEQYIKAINNGLKHFTPIPH